MVGFVKDVSKHCDIFVGYSVLCRVYELNVKQSLL